MKNPEQIFSSLKAILQKYEPQLTVKTDEPGNYYLDAGYSPEFQRDMFFGAVKVQKNYVSYYLMPVYVQPELLEGVSQGLKKRMQGKSCFNFKAVDEDLFAELEDLTRRGFEEYASRELISPDQVA